MELKIQICYDSPPICAYIRFVMLGQQGVGKSSIANSLLGYDNLANLGKKKNRKKVPFAVGHGLRSKTKMTSFRFKIWIRSETEIMKNLYSTGNFLGKTNSPNITVVDTPGFKVGFYKISSKVVEAMLMIYS